jgi:tagatose 1,6-diphosphate aldolase
MTKKVLTPGKWRGLKTTSDSGHTFSILAFDQRGNYHRMLPDGTTYTQAAEIKRQVVAALSPHVTAVLLDPNYGLPAALDTAGGSGLLMALEKTGYSGDPAARQVDFMDGWTVAKIKQMGASAVKLLVYYHPDTGAAAEGIEAVIQEVAAACTLHDIPLFVEPLGYNANDDSDVAFAEARTHIVTETARRLSRLGVDILKLEFPVDVKHNPDQDAWRAACQGITAVCAVPWALLSAGVDFEVFHQQVTLACQSGASGFLGGRAIWKEAVTMPELDRQQFLATTGIQRVQTLRETTARYGRAWTEFFAPMDAPEDWFQQYAKEEQL